MPSKWTVGDTVYEVLPRSYRGPGEVVGVTETQYAVLFGNTIVGCLEENLCDSVLGACAMVKANIMAGNSQ